MSDTMPQDGPLAAPGRSREQDRRSRELEAPIDGAPTWIRVLQAAIIGLVAGLALHALLSMVVLQGAGLDQKRSTPTQCKKANPSRDAGAVPKPVAPRISGLTWTLEAVQASREP